MIYVSDLNQLISQWLERMGNTTYASAYRDALNDCCYDLQKLINKSIEEELAAKESLESIETDYLSTIEAHDEHVA